MATDNVLFLPALSISEAAVGTNGSPPLDNNVKIVAGWDGTNVHTLLTDNTGKLLISNSSIPALGQATMANSLPVVIASDQSAVAITAAALPLPAGAATAANQTTEIGHLASIDAAINAPLSVSVTSSVLPTGAATETTLASIDSQLSSGISVSVSASALPTGAATAANQATEIAALASIDSKLTAPLAVDGSGFTQPISAAALPLPAGAATEATLATRASEATLATRASEATLATLATEATLSAINTKLVQLALGSQLSAASLAVVIASDQSAVPVTPAVSPLVTQDYGSIDAGSLTGSFATIMTTTAAAKIIAIFSSLDQPVTVSLDGGTTSIVNLDGESVVFDLGTSGMNLASGAVIQVKYSGSAPTTGSIRVSVLG